MVIGNDLNRRKYEVVFVSKHSDKSSAPESRKSQDGNDYTDTWLSLSQEEIDAGKEIEEGIVSRLVKMHDDWSRNAEFTKRKT